MKTVTLPCVTRAAPMYSKRFGFKLPQTIFEVFKLLLVQIVFKLSKYVYCTLKVYLVGKQTCLLYQSICIFLFKCWIMLTLTDLPCS